MSFRWTHDQYLSTKDREVLPTENGEGPRLSTDVDVVEGVEGQRGRWAPQSKGRTGRVGEET